MDTELRSLFDAHLGLDILSFESSKKLNVIYIKKEKIIRVLMILRDVSNFAYEQLVDLTVIDYPNDNLRFEICYNLLSHKNNKRLMVKFKINEETSINSVNDVFPNAIWYEREAWDLFGISFDNHPDLRRILCDYNFVGHALRKDFPLVGYVETYYNEEMQKVDYRKTNLNQAYRNFDFLSPWEGDWKHLLKAEENAHK